MQISKAWDLKAAVTKQLKLLEVVRLHFAIRSILFFTLRGRLYSYLSETASVPLYVLASLFQALALDYPSLDHFLSCRVLG